MSLPRRVVLPVLPVALGLGILPASCKTKDPPKPEGRADAGPRTTVITNEHEIPTQMGGAVAPIRPAPSAMPKPAPSSGAKAEGRAEAARPAAAAAAPSPVAAVEIVHNHPANEPCKPLTDEEVKRAMRDLRGAP